MKKTLHWINGGGGAYPQLGSEAAKRLGFTLAETLITLGIIGVVAAMTMPSLIAKYNEHVIITKYKKAYSTIANAYNLALAEYGDPINWGIEDMTEFFKRIDPYLNIAERCYDKAGCTSKGSYVSLSGELMWENLYGTAAFPKVRLSNGASIIMVGAPKQTCTSEVADSIGNISINENVCAQVYVVLTNTKSADYKNYYGKDFFNFDLTRQGVLPTGYKLSDSAVKVNCSKGGKGIGNGDTCGTWILRYHNMDYLHQ